MDKVVPRTPMMSGTNNAPEWIRFFQSIVRRSKDAPDVTVFLASPATVNIIQDGFLYLVGDNISAVSITRNGTTTVLGAKNTTLRVIEGDSVSVTYTGACSSVLMPE